MDRKQIKEWAKDKCKKYKWQVLGAVLIVSLINGALNGAIEQMDSNIFSLLLSVAVTLGSFILQVGLAKYMIAVKNDKEPELTELFSYFNKDAKNIVITGFFYTLFVTLFTFLLIVPGVVKALSYALVAYILVDEPNKNYKEVLKLSSDMMNGHKTDLFMLTLSFLGWHILAIFTLGILEIWIIPYQQLAFTKFLCDIKDNYKNTNTAKAVEA